MKELFTFRVEDELSAWILEQSKKENKTVTEFIVGILREMLYEEEISREDNNTA